MVKLLNNQSEADVANIIYKIFRFQERYTHIKEVNNPNIVPCIYAMWHSHQLCIHGIRDRQNLNVLISRSRDGKIIANVVERWGFKTIRGSKGKKGAVEASMKMISALKSGENCAMMVDGPKGPAKIVKDGIIKIAKLAGVPIVPVYWFSPNFNFASLPSWDKFKMPIFDVKLINLYGNPIYVSQYDDCKACQKKLQDSMETLEKEAYSAYRKVYFKNNVNFWHF